MNTPLYDRFIFVLCLVLLGILIHQQVNADEVYLDEPTHNQVAITWLSTETKNSGILPR